MNLSTTYLGLKLRTPLVPSASPLSEDVDNIKRMEDAGAPAVVLYSLFEEQIRYERYETELRRCEKCGGHYHRTAPSPEEVRTGWPEEEPEIMPDEIV